MGIKTAVLSLRKEIIKIQIGFQKMVSASTR